MAEPDPIITCPYDPVHRIRKSRMQVHLVKCRKNHLGLPKVNCPYNATHIINQVEYKYHLSVCDSAGSVVEHLCPVGHQNQISIVPVEEVQNIVLPPSSEDWDQEPPPRSTYDAEAAAAERNVLRSLSVASKSEKKSFKKKERERLRVFQDQGLPPPRREQQLVEEDTPLRLPHSLPANLQTRMGQLSIHEPLHLDISKLMISNNGQRDQENTEPLENVTVVQPIPAITTNGHELAESDADVISDYRERNAETGNKSHKEEEEQQSPTQNGPQINSGYPLNARHANSRTSESDNFAKASPSDSDKQSLEEASGKVNSKPDSDYSNAESSGASNAEGSTVDPGQLLTEINLEMASLSELEDYYAQRRANLESRIAKYKKLTASKSETTKENGVSADEVNASTSSADRNPRCAAQFADMAKKTGAIPKVPRGRGFSMAFFRPNDHLPGGLTERPREAVNGSKYISADGKKKTRPNIDSEFPDNDDEKDCNRLDDDDDYHNDRKCK
ncbi:uncharacterized protein LOC105702916 [Orussus abietinus]|uniref:uncharacterized protein LOC105702916 n=1 Tax=Orussus abietinus TaxID=222816 RepID=UPI000625D216|nr:uncharacterized protein LOC105702916 [Orussus abietinus]